jgi:hypothetical protein
MGVRVNRGVDLPPVCGNCERRIGDEDYPFCAVVGIAGDPDAPPVVLCGDYLAQQPPNQ